jgi:hypothetical protein
MLKQKPRTRPLSNRIVVGSMLPVLVALGTSLVLGGCSEEEVVPIVKKAPPPPPPPPPPPAVTPISDLMAQYNIDQRVDLPEQFAPDSDPSRIAVLQFYDAMVGGDVPAMSIMLSNTDKNELMDMDADGSFADAIAEIGSVQLRCGYTPGGDEAVVAIVQTYDDYQPQLWRFTADEYGSSKFISGPTPVNVMDKLSGNDWISSWYQLLDQEFAVAMQLDEEIQAPIRDLNKGEDAEISSGGANPGGPGRGRQPNRDRPTIDPPSFEPSNS